MHSMYRKLLMAIVLCVAGCASTVPVGTFNDKAAAGIETMTLVRKSATQLLLARKITVEQDQTIQAGLDVARKGIEIARSLQASDPTNAAAQLTAALEQLGALKKQTGVAP